MKEGTHVKITKFKGQLGIIKAVLPSDNYGNKYAVLFKGRKGKKYGIFKEKDLKEVSNIFEFPSGSEIKMQGSYFCIEYNSYDPTDNQSKIVLKEKSSGKLSFFTEDEMACVDFTLIKRPKGEI
jgi:hypothetical protein